MFIMKPWNDFNKGDDMNQFTVDWRVQEWMRVEHKREHYSDPGERLVARTRMLAMEIEKWKDSRHILDIKASKLDNELG